MSTSTLTDDQFDAWTGDRIREVVDAAVAEFGERHPDLPSILSVIGDALTMRARRMGDEGTAGARHLHPVD